MAGALPGDLDEATGLAWLAFAAGRKRARQLLAEEASVVGALERLDPAPGELRGFLIGLERHPVQLIPQWDTRYPPLLSEIPDPPLVLYVSGDPDGLRCPTVAIVGARRCSRSGAAIAARFASQLAALDLVVVSGLALGIDAAAHRGALQTGRTAAVLGAGLARIYPAVNRSLADRILATGGILVSEYPPHQTARTYHFPERNRLISGLSLGVLVVEAGERSGSLITARLALEQGRDVMAVPGSIENPASRGCHRLLRDGASLVETVADVVELLGWSVAGVVPKSGALREDRPGPAGAELAALLSLLGEGVTTFDELCARSTGGPAMVAARLLELELGGFVEQVSGGYIRRAVATP